MSTAGPPFGQLSVQWSARIPPARPDTEYGIGPFGGDRVAYVAWLTDEEEMTVLPRTSSDQVPRSPADGDPITDPAILAQISAAIEMEKSLYPDPNNDPLRVVAKDKYVTASPWLESRCRYTLTGECGGRVLYYADQGRYGFWPTVISAETNEVVFEEPVALWWEPHDGGDPEVVARVCAAIGRYLYQDVLTA